MQLPLNIQLPQAANFDSYVPGENLFLVELLKQCADLGGESQLYCWSEPGLGKTHLLQATVRLAAQNDHLCSYLPLGQLVGQPVSILDDLESVQLLCIDELEAIAGQPEWETALFALINRSRLRRSHLVFAAAANINKLPWTLPDLASRLSWGPVFQIKPLRNDADKIKVLQLRARGRGFEFPDELGTYMLGRYSRDIRRLCEQLETLDRASLSAQRRLTIPFAKSVLEED